MPLTEISGARLASTEQLTAAAERVIGALAGPDAVVRPDQLAAAAAVAVEGRPALVVQATGWGKSAVYWIATAALRSAGAGPTVIVSPLLALMRDQVTAAGRAGIRAATVNSSNVDEWDTVLAALEADEIDALLLSPERLANPTFAARWMPILRERGGLVVIDEAHCLSDWGHDFRPDYRRVSANLLADRHVPVLATTATANERVTADVAAQLGDDTEVLRGSLTRDSLALCVVDGLSGPERLAWIDTALGSLPGSGIVYALTVADATRISEWLIQRGHKVACYTGSTPTEDRVRIENALRDNELKAVVATSALGMGYDKPDLAFCIHHGSPASPVDYYQQVGRAGRALDHAPAVLLPAESDERVWEYFATATVPDPDLAATVLAHLRNSGGPMTVPALVSSTGGRKSRVEGLLRNLAVDGAVVREPAGWSTTGEPWTYDHERYDSLVRARRAEAALMRTYAHGNECLSVVLRQALDDAVEPGWACGRCGVCTGTLPSGVPAVADERALSEVGAWLRGVDIKIAPRQMWPAKIEGRSGRIAVGNRAAEGRALAFADDPGWSVLVSALTARGAADAVVPDKVLEGLVGVLGRWRSSWGERPIAVVPMPSRTRPLLIESMAEGIGSVGKLPVVHALAADGPRPPSDVASGPRVESLLASLSLTGEPVPAGPVLLVDDTARSTWTLTVAADLLLGAGATAVLPLVLHQLP